MMSYQNNKPQLRFSGFEGEWKQKRLGEVSNFLDGRRKPIKSDDRTKMKGEYPYYGASGIIDYVNNYIFDEELILLGEDGENIISRNSPLAFRVSGKCWINNHAHVIVPKENTNIDFLTHNLERINYVVYNTGTAQPKLNQEVCRNISSWFPTLPEQQKIASFLSAVDEKIQQISRKKELLEQYKKGVMQQLFSGKLRFKDENGDEYEDWKPRKMNEVLFEHKLNSTGKEEVFSVSVHKGLINQIEHLGRVFAAKNTDNYNLVMPGDIVYTKSPTGSFPLGIIKQSKVNKDVIVSPLYGIFTPETQGLGYMLNVYFEAPINVNNYLASIIQKGAKNTINITNTTFLSKKMKLPVSKEEQNKIGNFLEQLDSKIESTTQQITQMQTFKKGLLQKMFV
jgi:type I restriction enzyme S subunit